MDAGWATLVELQGRWSLMDILNACEALDALDEARSQASKKKG
jgi:hypothetical protein